MVSAIGTLKYSACDPSRTGEPNDLTLTQRPVTPCLQFGHTPLVMVSTAFGCKTVYLPGDGEWGHYMVANLEALDSTAYFADDSHSFVAAYVTRFHPFLGMATIPVQFASRTSDQTLENQ